MKKTIFKKLLYLLIMFFFLSCNKSQEKRITYNKYLKRAISQIEENYSGFNDKYLEDSVYYTYLKSQLLNDSIYSKYELIQSLESYLGFFRDNHLYLKENQNTENSGFSLIVDNGKPQNSNSGKNTNKQIKKLPDIHFKIIDSHTSYLKVPTFKTDFAYITDSIIEQNLNQIITRDLLIIDIRGNGGGVDRGWLPLIPFIYTNSINGLNIEVFTSEDNVAYTKQSRKNQYLNDKMDLNPNSYVKLFGEKYIRKIIYNYDVLPKPKYVAILVDRHVMSSGERFVLAAKQSMKTKIFGENTKGGIDYTNLRFVDIIDSELKMSIPTTRTMGLPQNSIDASGIIPDFYIDMDTPIIEVVKIYKQIF